MSYKNRTTIKAEYATTDDIEVWSADNGDGTILVSVDTHENPCASVIALTKIQTRALIEALEMRLK